MPAVGTSTANAHCRPARAVGLVERVDVEVGEVAVADGHEVAERAEVGLESVTGSPSRLTVTVELGLGAGDERRRRASTS